MQHHELVQKLRHSRSESITEIVISDDDDVEVLRESRDGQSSKWTKNENLEESLDLQNKENIPASSCNRTTGWTDTVHIPCTLNRMEQNSKSINTEPTASLLEELDECTLLDGITEDLDKSSDVELDEDFFWEDDITKLLNSCQSPTNDLTKVDSSKCIQKTSISSASPDNNASNQIDKTNVRIGEAKERQEINGLTSNAMLVHNDDQSKPTKPIDTVSKESSEKKKIETSNAIIRIKEMPTHQLASELKETSLKSDKGKSLTDLMLGKDNSVNSSTKTNEKDDDNDVIIIESSNKRPASPVEIEDSLRKTKMFISGVGNLRESVEKAAAASAKKPSEGVRDLTNEKESSIELLENNGGIRKVTNVQPFSDPTTQRTDCPSQFELNFVRKFQKDFVDMNRDDLEELLIQKCVETIVHKSEYANMRNKIFAQEKKLKNYSTKYHELRKQFIDLQIVLQSVMKDLKAKNRDVVIPHKITRAVGLQVSMPRKKKENPPRRLVIDNITTINKQNTSTLGNRSDSSLKSLDAAERPQSAPVILKTPTQTVSVMTSSTPNSISGTAEVCESSSNLANTPISRSPVSTSATNNIIDLVDGENSECVVSSRRIVQPLPQLPNSRNQPTKPQWKLIPPWPKIIEILNSETGIIISWNMEELTDEHAKVVSYQIYSHKETLVGSPSEEWRLVDHVEPMLLPMAVTLTHFEVGQRYHFSVRAKDEHGRYGIFSLPKTF